MPPDADRQSRRWHRLLAPLFAALLLTGCLGGDPPSGADTPAPVATTAANTAVPVSSPSISTPDETPTDGAMPDWPGEVVPVAGIVDGDTLRVMIGDTKETLRIIGIDAPELSEQECYAQAAASKMQSLVQSKDVRIFTDPTQADRDRYGRILRHVWTLDGRNVAHELISLGLGTEYTYDKAYFGQQWLIDAETAARSAGLGMWGACDVVLAQPAPTTTEPVPTESDPVAPVPLAPSAPVELPSEDEREECDIKGNINRKGEKIYHMPGQRHYDVTKIDESNGERWFCTEQEALDAGWRKAKV